MLLLFRKPSGLIAHAVEHITFHQGYLPTHAREVFVPDGGCEVVIDLSDAPKQRWHDEHGERFDMHKRGWVSGMRSSRIVIGVGSGAPMLVLRLRPGVLPSLVGMPAHELNDTVVDLDLLLGAVFSTVRDTLGETLEQHGAHAMLDKAEAILAPLFPARQVERRVDIALDAMLKRNGIGTVGSISDELGCSQKHLNELFQRHCGLGPKRYASLVRFQTLLRRLEHETDPDWAQLALEHGFYDQSHLVNTFREMTGLSPTRYMEAKGHFLNWLPVDGR
ncbi:MAG TPA: helix-turn-helix domain-containing protein [Flavobacteriales bacterium]|nr:helix-turn-helix domain-containing protein [Flavobacteriales bacterium]HMR28160.1 helix-turn-helix domain-containing protein [Flavobacteriales bacterium]